MAILTWCLYFQFLFLLFCHAGKIRYISTERPFYAYNPKYIRYANLTAQRYGRHDPFYYVGYHVDFLWPFDNNITVDFVFYEFLSNRYSRSFVEMHFKFCDMIQHDKFFGASMRQGKFNQPCPFPAGEYNLYNMTIPLKQIPSNFPFTKGRIYCNFTGTYNKEFVGGGHIDMEIKEAKI